MMDRRRFLAVLAAPLAIPPLPWVGPVTVEPGTMVMFYQYIFRSSPGGQLEPLFVNRPFSIRSILLDADEPIKYKLTAGPEPLMDEFTPWGGDMPFLVLPPVRVERGQQILIEVQPEGIPWLGGVAGVIHV